MRTGMVIAIGVIDNLGRGPVAQAVQNANLMTGQQKTAGLNDLPFGITAKAELTCAPRCSQWLLRSLSGSV
jgi:hypothetical protein